MSYGRGFPERGIQAENRIGQGSWTAAILGQIPQRGGESSGETPRNYPKNRIGQGSWTAAILGQTPQRGGESLGETPRNYPDNRIGQGSWTAAILGQTPQRGSETSFLFSLPVPYRSCYDLNSPPRIELDALSSDISPLPFTPITPDTQRRLTDNQWVPAKNGHESQRNEDADNLCIIGESTSSVVSTTQKEILVSEEGDDLGITSMGNGIGDRDSRTMVHQVNGNNGIVQNGDNRNQTVMPTTNMHSQGNRNVSSPWTIVTPGKPIPQGSHVVAGNQTGNEKWEDLVGMYEDLLEEKTLNLNEVAQDHYQNCGNQNQVATTAKQNLNLSPNPKK